MGDEIKPPGAPRRMPAPRPAAPSPAAEPVHTARAVGPVQLHITGDVTIPATAGYARRLANLIESVKTGLQEEHPWLTNIEVTVDRQR